MHKLQNGHIIFDDMTWRYVTSAANGAPIFSLPYLRTRLFLFFFFCSLLHFGWGLFNRLFRRCFVWNLLLLIPKWIISVLISLELLVFFVFFYDISNAIKAHIIGFFKLVRASSTAGQWSRIKIAIVNLINHWLSRNYCRY